MSSETEIRTAVMEILTEMLNHYDARVTTEGQFDDLRLKRQVEFGDPDTTSPGLLELTVMAMGDSVNPAHRSQRFLAVRVKRSARGGMVSTTLFHGTKDQLRDALERERKQPDALALAVEELLFGLPEETNPNLWR